MAGQKIDRRQLLTSASGVVLGSMAGAGSPSVSSAASSSRLPYESVRIIELSNTLTGRLAGLLFADQGAEVLVAPASPTTSQMSMTNSSIATSSPYPPKCLWTRALRTS